MSIRGVGIDIEAVGRFRKKSYKNNPSFYKKIFTAGEIKYCLSKADPSQHFAARFAAKEAVVKTINRRKIDLKKIEIVNDKNGKPGIKLSVTSYQLPVFLVSLSHTKDYAIAICLKKN